MPQEFKYLKETLPGGLRMLLMPRSEVGTVTLMVLVGVGSRYESPKQQGLSHFLEHMFFKGTEKRPDKKEIAEAMDRVGAEFNAFTSEELTAFYVKVPAENLELGADVVSDILIGSLFPAAEIEREKGVIKEEIKMYTDNPMHHVQHLWAEVLFGTHPLGRRIDGTEKTVDSFSRQHFKRYTSQHYHTGNTVVALAGKFQDDRAQKLVKSLFEKLPAGSETKPRPAPRQLPVTKFKHERRDRLDQTHLMVGVPGVSQSDRRRFAAEVLAVVLGGGMSSRLFMKVREENGLAYAIRCGSETFTDTGSFVTAAGLRTDKADFALKLILAEYDRVMSEAVSAEELNKAKQMIRGRMVMGLEETNAIALYAGAQELLEHRIQTPLEIWQAVEAVTPNQVQQLAQELLAPDKRAVALLSPHRSTKAFETALKF